jgi:tRNA (guanine-N7-)-methyltransferase
MQTERSLRIPFEWKDRHPVMLDRCLYVPDAYDFHEEWNRFSWSDPAVFGNENPVALEYCSGNGEWICERAKQFPEINWVGIEKRFDRVTKMWKRLKRENLSNLFILCGDARCINQHYLPKASIQESFINFPDPWPKRQHAKHRLLQKIFFDQIKEILMKGARFVCVTDDFPYANQMLSEMKECQGFSPVLNPPYYTTNLENYGSSFFFDLWTKKGKTIYHLPFVKL